MNELQIFLVETIKAQAANSPLNRLKDIDGSPIWEEPLVGFADGNDPVFNLFKSVVAPEHWMPRDALAAKVHEGSGKDQPVSARGRRFLDFAYRHGDETQQPSDDQRPFPPLEQHPFSR